MKKQFRLLICLVLCCLVLLQLPHVGAAPLDTRAEAALTLQYQNDGVAFGGLRVRVYRVAEAFENGMFGLIAPYSGYRVNIHGITQQSQWQAVADTLSGYIAADAIPADREVTTDDLGVARLESLQTGLYLVEQAVAQTEDGTYLFNRFMVYVPTPQADGTYVYDVQAKPKCIAFTPKTHYSVTKLWQDEGSPIARPQAVTVEICHNGVPVTTQILSSENNWTYNWTVSGEDDGGWTVAERSVPSHYTVTVSQNGNVFSIINTCDFPPDIPQTGDSFALLPWILGMCISGLLLLILGIRAGRRK